MTSNGLLRVRAPGREHMPGASLPPELGLERLQGVNATVTKEGGVTLAGLAIWAPTLRPGRPRRGGWGR